MDTTKCRAHSPNALNISEQESQWNLQMLTPIIKQETVQHLDEEDIPECMNEEKNPQCMDEDDTFCNDYMSPCKPLGTSECVDYRDSKFYVFKEVKKEFPEDECPQPVHNRNNGLVFENKELSQLVERQELKQENSEKNLVLIKTEKTDYEQYPVIVKIESLQEHRVLDNCGDASVHYDVLVTPQQVQCKLCDRTFNNRYCLLVHNNEHIKVVMYPTLMDIEINELHKCKCCNKYFNSQDNMVAHFRDVHSNIKPYLNKNNTDEMEYKCDLCMRVYKSKETLVEHKKRIHVDYGRMFECSCGKQFRTPHHLYQHKTRQHNPNINNQQFQCDYCHNFFKTKYYLIIHIRTMHYDYGKTLRCSCGKQFRTPVRLHQHNQQVHGAVRKIINNEGIQCHICQKLVKAKRHLTIHIKNVHYDYGKTFECWCGKQFHTPSRLRRHECTMHSTNCEYKFQCDSCGKFFKNKGYLVRHIKHVHYDYGKMFLCWCGKQFSKPTLLQRHERRQHPNTNITALKAQFQCDICSKFFKAKRYLTEHKRNVHYDYGKVFVCACGKQFRTPLRLNRHKKNRHYNKNMDMVDVNTNIAI